MSTYGGSTAASLHMRPYFAKTRGLPETGYAFRIGNRAAPPAAIEWWDTHVYRTHLRSPLTSMPGSPRERPMSAAISSLSPRALKARGTMRPGSAMNPAKAKSEAGNQTTMFPDPVASQATMAEGGCADHPLKGELSQVYRALRLLDLNGDGQLAPTDVVRGLSSFGLAVGHDAEATKAVNTLLMKCMQGSGKILYQSFVYKVAQDTKIVELILARKAAKIAKYKADSEAYQLAMAKNNGKPANRGPQLRPGVQAAELRNLQQLIKNKLGEKFNSFTAAFRSMDKDGSGYVTRKELTDMLSHLNLGGARAALIDTLIDFVDIENDVDDRDDDGDCDIGYPEFARAFTIDDIMNMKPSAETLKKRNPAPPPPPTPPPQNIVASQVSQAIQAKFKPDQMLMAFNFFDKDKSKSLTRAEVRRILATWGVPLTDEELIELFKTCDSDGNGKIDYKEFCDIVSNNPAIANTREVVTEPALRKGVRPADLRRCQRTVHDTLTTKYGKLADAFKFFDKDRTNSITREELKWGLGELNLNTMFKDEVVENLLDFIDIDPQGDIEFREFARVVAADDVLSMAPLRAFQTVQQSTGYGRNKMNDMPGMQGLSWSQISG